MKVIVCIPARYDSKRLPGKVLARDTGKYLVQHTYEQACKAALPFQILIAADDPRILGAAKTFGAPCVLTRPDHQSGTDRIAEAVADLDCDIVVNVQADEPRIEPAYIDQVAKLLINSHEATIKDSECGMATLAAPFADQAQIANPHIVKVITDLAGRAIYFSRSVIPYDRDGGGVGARSLRHLGIYAYRKNFLLEITRLPRTPLEKTEKLEQLRAVEHGFSIRVGVVPHAHDGIDTPEQYQHFVQEYTGMTQQ